MIVEKKPMEGYSIGGGETIGHIEFRLLAIPETVKVTLEGEPIIPCSFDEDGHPNFTEEQYMLYVYKKYELKRQNGGEYVPLYLDVTYEERKFDVPREKFDTITGIESSIGSLADLNELIRNRRVFAGLDRSNRLDEFMLFGCFYLNDMGSVMSIDKKSRGTLKVDGDVETFMSFRSHNFGRFHMTTAGFSIPEDGMSCPCCGRAFTIEDIKDNPCVRVDGKYYHDSCWTNYRRLTEIDEFTRNLMSIVYKDSDYTFDLLPNGYCHEECCAHIPWFMFHTIDGDIKIGWRKRVISIEWQENYEPFDFPKLFESEDVTKWEEEGRRGIHAWGKDKAYEYLNKVLTELHPDYEIW